MINIRPISDLRNKFTEIEKMVKKGEVVHLTKNGYGSMVVMSTERYSQLLEAAGKEAEQEENGAGEPGTCKRAGRGISGNA